jgi:CHAT domain-containing protein
LFLEISLVGQASVQATESTVRPATARLDVKKLEHLLDNKEVAGAIQFVEMDWKYQYEEYYQGQLTTQILDASAISQRLTTLFRSTGKRTALLYVVPTPSHLELILIPPGARPIHRRVSAADRDTLQQAVKAFRDGVMNPISRRLTYLPPAQRLYQFIISPVEQELKANRIDTLVFCLGGGLRTLPLAALHDGDRFLIEKYNLAIIPAFNLLDSRPASLKGVEYWLWEHLSLRSNRLYQVCHWN